MQESRRFYKIFEMGKYVWTTYLIRPPGIQAGTQQNLFFYFSYCPQGFIAMHNAARQRNPFRFKKKDWICQITTVKISMILKIYSGLKNTDFVFLTSFRPSPNVKRVQNGKTYMNPRGYIQLLCIHILFTFIFIFFSHLKQCYKAVS